MKEVGISPQINRKGKREKTKADKPTRVIPRKSGKISNK